MSIKFTIEIETIPVHFGQDYNGSFWYWPETGYTSKGFEDLGKAIAAAKQEVKELVDDYGCLPMWPDNPDYSWLPFNPNEF